MREKDGNRTGFRSPKFLTPPRFPMRGSRKKDDEAVGPVTLEARHFRACPLAGTPECDLPFVLEPYEKIALLSSRLGRFLAVCLCRH
jgi:hypothetical protein